MTPIQHAIEQVKERMENTKRTQSMFTKQSGQWKTYSPIIRTLQIQLKHLQSLLPVEKEFMKKVNKDGWDDGFNDASPHSTVWSQTFEQYYSQFNEVK